MGRGLAKLELIRHVCDTTRLGAYAALVSDFDVHIFSLRCAYGYAVEEAAVMARHAVVLRAGVVVAALAAPPWTPPWRKIMV